MNHVMTGTNQPRNWRASRTRREWRTKWWTCSGGIDQISGAD